MDLFTRDDLTMLLEQPRSDSVSLYLPTHRAGPETQQDPIRMANLVRHAEEELVRGGMRRRDAVDILAPARRLGTDVEFWRYAGDGLAAFFRAGWWRAYRLPLAFDDLFVVSDRCHVLPLLPLLTGDGRYFVLALSENEARLLGGTRAGVHPVAVPGMPHGVRDALRFDEPQKQRGHHLGERVGTKVRTVLHGQGIGAEVQKERLGRYLHQVDHAVSAVLRGQDAPLVLAGVNHIRAAYRDVTGYPHVLKAGVSGSPDRVPDADLHARAWPLVAEIFVRGRTEAARTYRGELGTGLAVDNLADAAAAAETDRVEVLFLPATADPLERERLESTAAHTIRAGGTVYVVPADAVPGTGPVAALLRH